MKDCKKPCHSLEVSLIGHKSDPSNHTILNIFFKTIVTRSEEKHLYTWRNLFAEIGGYVGMFLGYSFFSIGKAIARMLKQLLEKAKGTKPPRKAKTLKSKSLY